MVARRVEALHNLRRLRGRQEPACRHQARRAAAGRRGKKGTVVADGVSEALLSLTPRRSFSRRSRRFRPRRPARSKETSARRWPLSRRCARLVDRFFTDVLVNDEDAAIRANRLALLPAHPRRPPAPLPTSRRSPADPSPADNAQGDHRQDRAGARSWRSSQAEETGSGSFMTPATTVMGSPITGTSSPATTSHNVDTSAAPISAASFTGNHRLWRSARCRRRGAS